MENQYRPIKSMKEVPEQIRKIRRQYLRYQQAEPSSGWREALLNQENKI